MTAINDFIKRSREIAVCIRTPVHIGHLNEDSDTGDIETEDGRTICHVEDRIYEAPMIKIINTHEKLLKIIETMRDALENLRNVNGDHHIPGVIKALSACEELAKENKE